MKSYRVLVRTPRGLASQGTGWLIGPRTVCTAFHVVGHCSERKWMHQYVDGATYWLNDDSRESALTPALYDSVGDVALLSCVADAGEPHRLAEQSRVRVPWSAAGYPGFHNAGLFTISGSVVALLEGDRSNRAMQLHVAQGTGVLWEGISGAPVLDEGSVAGLITNVTNAVSTAWAVPVSAIRRLEGLRAFVAEAAVLLADTPMASTARQFEQADEQTIARVLEALHRERPHDERVDRLHATFALCTAAPVPSVLSPQHLADLRETYAVLPVREGVRRIRPLAARQFRDLFLSNARFGGRQTELRKLDAFVSDVPSGYFFLTGTSGYGKTSLLAYWVEALRRRGDVVVFHFFTRRMPETLEPDEAFGRLAEQLMAVHDLGGELPRDRVRLQSLCVDLLQAPAPGGRPLIVVLDALDEVIETIRPGPAMFPHPLGPGVRVVFSARSMAAKDWPADLHLTLDASQCLTLGQLNHDDIVEIVARAGIDPTPPLVTALLQKTDGDPFYVSDVVRVLVEGGTAEAVEALPPTHSAYLRAWWDDALERVRDPGFVDLMGTLAALRAPLAPKELVAVSKDDRLEAARIGVLLKNAARYVDGEGLYWLRHDRIRQFVRDTLGDDMATYQDRVIAFARRWNDRSATDAARAYGRRHAVQHLLETDRFDDALALVDSEFIAERWREDGSYAPLIANLDAMLEWAQDHPQARTATSYAPALAVMRETVRDLMRDLKPELLRAWMRLDDPACLKELIDSLPSHRGEARDPLLALAEEILDGAPAGQPSAADRAWAAELIGRVIGLLPFVRTAAWTQEAWSRVCPLLAGNALDPALVASLLQQGAAFIEQAGADARDLKAVCFAGLASAALRSNPSAAKSWLDQAETLASELGAGDRAFVAAKAVPAYRAFAGEQLDQTMEELIRAYAASPEDSTFSRSPIEALIEAWTPRPEVMRRLLASGVLADARVEAPTLLKLGLESETWQSIDEATEHDRPTAVRLLLRCFEVAPAHRPEIRRRLGALARGGTDFNPVNALAVAGRWNDVLATIDQYPSDLAAVLPDCVGRALEDLHGAERERVVDALVGRLDTLSAEHAAEPAAQIALLFARAGHPRARPMLGIAWRFGLGHLPEGDADALRQIAALALAVDGMTDRASALARGCQWLHLRVAALCSMVLEVGDDGKRLSMARQIEEVLDNADLNDTGSFVSEALSTICRTARDARSGHGEASATLARLVARLISRQGLQTDWSLLSDYVALAELVEPETHADTLREVATAMWNVSGDSEDIPHNLRALFRVAVHVVERDIASADLIESLLAHTTRETSKAPQAKGAAAAGWSRRDPERAVQLFEEAIAALPSAAVEAEAQSGIGHYFRRFLGDLVSGPGNQAHAITDPAINLGDSIVAAASALERIVVGRLLAKVWGTVHDAGLTGAQLDLAVNGFVDSIAAVPPTHLGLVERLMSAVASDVEAARDQLDADGLFARVAFSLARHGHLSAAQAAAALIQDQQSRERAEYQIELFAFVRGLPDQSPVERAFLEMAEEKGVAAVIIKMIREGQTDDLLSQWIASLREGRVRNGLMKEALYHMPGVHARWGAKGMEHVALAMQDVDRRVLEAATRVGAV